MIQRFGIPRQVQLALVVIRVAAGIIFIAHGYQKFFTTGIDATADFFGQAGVPLPGIIAPFIATLELAGGIALLLGLFARPLAALFAADMAGAIIFVHAKNGFFVPRGIEFVMMVMAAAIAIALAGPGSPSVDNVIDTNKRSKQRPTE